MRRDDSPRPSPLLGYRTSPTPSDACHPKESGGFPEASEFMGLATTTISGRDGKPDGEMRDSRPCHPDSDPTQDGAQAGSQSEFVSHSGARGNRGRSDPGPPIHLVSGSGRQGPDQTGPEAKPICAACLAGLSSIPAIRRETGDGRCKRSDDFGRSAASGIAISDWSGRADPPTTPAVHTLTLSIIYIYAVAPCAGLAPPARGSRSKGRPKIGRRAPPGADFCRRRRRVLEARTG